MSATTPLEMQRTALLTLFDRATKGHWTDASLSRPRISKLVQQSTGIQLAPAVLQIYLDGLVADGLVSMPQRGVRDRYQITTKGIQFVGEQTAGLPIKVASESWTGQLDRRSITENDVDQMLGRLRQLRVVIEGAELTNTARSQAEALVTAAVCMTEAPDPPWEIIKQVLLVLGSISTLLTLALEIAKMIN